MHPEFGFGVNGFLGLGESATVSKWGYGGDGTLSLVHLRGGLGLRAAGGYQWLQGHQVGTGETIFNGTGTQESQFAANQHFTWLAIGPEWSTPAGNGRVDYFFMVGKATVNATSGGTFSNVAGADPGTTHASLVLAGAIWSLPRGRVDLGAELFMSGSSALWDDPPIVSDGGSGFVTQGHNASITGISARLGYHFGRRTGSED